MAFVYDPELPAINTPNGKVEFLQVVGITLDEDCNQVMEEHGNELTVLGYEKALVFKPGSTAKVCQRKSPPYNSGYVYIKSTILVI